MELRLLDEVTPLPGYGIVLMSMDDTRGEGLEQLFASGAVLRDALGAHHPVERAEEQDGLYLLFLPGAEAAYWERLFRKVTVDATLVTICRPEKEEQL